MFQTNTPNDPPAATLTATATPSAATVRGRTNFICSRRLALRRSPYRHVANSSRGGLPTCTRSYARHRIRATCAVAAATRASRAARPSASTFSQRSSRGARFQRLHLGQITHSRPFHSSNARRRPTPSPEGPPSPSSLPLQKAQVLYIGRPLTVVRHPSRPGRETLHHERPDVDVRVPSGQKVRDDLAREGCEQDAVTTVPRRIPQSRDVGIAPE